MRFAFGFGRRCSIRYTLGTRGLLACVHCRACVQNGDDSDYGDDSDRADDSDHGDDSDADEGSAEAKSEPLPAEDWSVPLYLGAPVSIEQFVL